MRPVQITAFSLWLVAGLSWEARAEEPRALLEKAIQAIGGEEKLKKAETLSWNSKGTVNFNGNDVSFKGKAIARGLDHMRREIVFVGDDGERTFLMVLGGDKGWWKFGEQPTEMEGDALANEKRNAAMEVLSTTLVGLKANGYKLESAGEETVAGKPAVGLKVTMPQGKDFTLFFDRTTNLPVKAVARVMGFQGEEFTQETYFRDYKDFDGIKKATRIEMKRDGEDFIKTEVSDFKVLDRADPKAFTEPS